MAEPPLLALLTGPDPEVLRPLPAARKQAEPLMTRLIGHGLVASLQHTDTDIQTLLLIQFLRCMYATLLPLGIAANNVVTGR